MMFSIIKDARSSDEASLGHFAMFMNFFRSGAAQSIRAFLLALLILLAVAATSLYSYLLFHGVAELFSIIVACAVFLLAWNTRRFSDNNYLLFIAIAFLFVAVLDGLHTFAYKGMGVFPASPETEANLPTQLWIAARYLQALSFLIAPVFLNRKLPLGLVFAGYGATTALLTAAVFTGIFPDAFLPETGLTPFKIISEYVICLVFALAAAFLYSRRDALDPRVLRLLLVSIGLSIASDLAFTLYVDVYGVLNLVGHLLKIAATYYIYKAIVETGLVQPYSLLFRHLKHAEERLRSLFEDAPVMYITAQIADGQIVITGCNDTFLRVLGYGWNQVINQPLSRFSRYGSGGASPGELLDQREADHEHDLVTRSGETIHTLRRVRVEAGSASHDRELRIAFLDVTARRQAERAEQEQRQFAEALASISATLSSTLDLDEVLDRILNLVEHVAPHERASVLLLDAGGLLIARQRRAGDGAIPAPAQPPQPLESFPSLVESITECRPVLVTGPAADRAFIDYLGGVEDSSYAVAPISVEKTVAGFIAVTSTQAHPLTQAQADRLQAFANAAGTAIRNAQLYREAQQAKDRAEHADAVKMRFLGMISHELRTPLASIKGFASTLLEPDVEFAAEDQRDFLGIIDSESDKLTDLIEQLLDITRLEAGTFKIHPEPTRVEDIFELARHQLEVLAANHGLTIEIEHPVPALTADRQRIAQVLTNLVGNAVKYSPPGTTITVTACAEGDQVRMDVIDQGAGIPDAERERVFKTFWQVETQPDNRNKGAGLGLTISKGLIEAHGGRIWVDAHDGPGAKISFVLPAAGSDGHSQRPS